MTKKILAAINGLIKDIQRDPSGARQTGAPLNMS
jgi:hypothetical protein